MRRILHLSDLHFGRDRPELVRPLIETVNRLAPDVVAISGDLTQRARLGQYRAARAFIDHLAPPTLVVPGNHDVPLDNLYVRLIHPWRRFRAYISADLEPQLIDDEVALVGVNTVNPYAWQNGRIGRHAVGRVCAAFGPGGDPAARAARMHVVVLHHPLEQTPGSSKRLMSGAGEALRRMGDCGADIVLSGHLHTWRAEPFTTAAGVLLVQAGTGLSTRVRGEPNDFNLLHLSSGGVTVDRYAASADAHHFEVLSSTVFRKSPDGWAVAE